MIVGTWLSCQSFLWPFLAVRSSRSCACWNSRDTRLHFMPPLAAFSQIAARVMAALALIKVPEFGGGANVAKVCEIFCFGPISSARCDFPSHLLLGFECLLWWVLQLCYEEQRREDEGVVYPE